MQQLSLFDDLALKNNANLIQDEPQKLEEKLNDNLLSQIKEKVEEFDTNFPVSSCVKSIFLSCSHIFYDLDKDLELSLNHGDFFFDPREQSVKTDENFGIKLALCDKKNNIDIIKSFDDFHILYERKDKQEYCTSEELKSVKIDKDDLNIKLKDLQLKLQNYLKGENDDRLNDIKTTNKNSSGENLQRPSKSKPISVGLDESIDARSLTEPLHNETKGTKSRDGFREYEARRDERRPTQTSLDRSKDYRLPNEARDRDGKSSHKLTCETLARNSLESNEDLAKNSQKLLNYAELIKEYEQALLKLHLSTKSQEELEHFHKCKTIYANFSQKFRAKDSFSKIEEKYQKQKDILTKEQKGKMLEDFMLVLSTNTKVDLSEDTKEELYKTLLGKTNEVKKESEEIAKAVQSIKEMQENLKQQFLGGEKKPSLQDKRVMRKLS
ncbi:hypothetical protein FDR72_09280 [Campylobacter helveticus]|uniref:hypothetical protein n=1 Tax=Campylobacter helveticus TaxID=28898 RepID=UPI001112571A|nr:hypothetical protein [Campylobacter helveticus]TNB58558.1 hypothetical protein FDR72_09280 [Campylobacter helveticus]